MSHFTDCSLRAGPWSLDLVGADLRGIRAGGREAVQRVYVAVRDRSWGTVPARIVERRVEAGSDSFRIDLAVEHRREEIDFAWTATVTGAADGTITYAFDGVARSTFVRARIGLCVLLPRTLAGQRYRVAHASGAGGTGTLPELIAADQPVLDIARISCGFGAGGEAELGFIGEVFEMEDQRNWCDASYKIYGTPLALPYPVEIAAGTRVRQQVVLRMSAAPATARDTAALTIGPPSGRTLPTIGTRLPTGRLIGLDERQRLAALRLAHVRADIALDDPLWRQALEHACSEARAVSAPLELAVRAGTPDAPWRDIARVLDRERIGVVRVLVFDSATRTTPTALAQAARVGLATLDAPIGGGSDEHFCALNRERPDASVLDVVAFDLHHQVHARDDRSMMENVAAIDDALASARALAGGRPIALTPLTIDSRSRADARMRSDFGAAWLCAALARAASSGAASVTCLEAAGPAGLVDGSDAFATCHLLGEIAPFAQAAVLTTGDCGDLRVLALQTSGRTRVLIANVSPEPRPVRIEGLASARTWRHIGRSDPHTLADATLTGYGVAVVDG